MRKLKVRHERLPGIGDLFEVDTESGLTVIVATHRSGRRDIAVRERGQAEVSATVALTRAESLAVATLLTGAHIELTTTPRT